MAIQDDGGRGGDGGQAGDRDGGSDGTAVNTIKGRGTNGCKVLSIGIGIGAGVVGRCMLNQ